PVAGGVVHDGVERARPFEREVDRGDDGGLVGHVALRPRGPPTARVDLADDRVPVPGAGTDDHVRAGGRAGQRDPAPDAVAGAGHDDAAPVEGAGHGAITDPPSTITVAPVMPPLVRSA